jgi:hypothetical protein
LKAGKRCVEQRLASKVECDKMPGSVASDRQRSMHVTECQTVLQDDRHHSMHVTERQTVLQVTDIAVCM